MKNITSTETINGWKHNLIMAIMVHQIVIMLNIVRCY